MKLKISFLGFIFFLFFVGFDIYSSTLMALPMSDEESELFKSAVLQNDLKSIGEIWDRNKGQDEHERMLRMVIKSEYEDVAIFLLEKRSIYGDMNAPFSSIIPIVEGVTPLHYAAAYSRAKIVDYLLQNPKVKNLEYKDATVITNTILSQLINKKMYSYLRLFLTHPNFNPAESWFDKQKFYYDKMIGNVGDVRTFFEERMKHFILFERSDDLPIDDIKKVLKMGNSFWFSLYLARYPQLLDQKLPIFIDDSGMNNLICYMAFLTKSSEWAIEKEKLGSLFINVLTHMTSLPLFCNEEKKLSLLHLIGDDSRLFHAVVDHSFFKKSGWDINPQDASGKPLAFSYVEDKKNKLLETLLNHPRYLEHDPMLNPLAPDSSGETILHKAIRSDNLGAIPILAKHPIIKKMNLSFSPKNGDGMTPWVLPAVRKYNQEYPILKYALDFPEFKCGDMLSCLNGENSSELDNLFFDLAEEDRDLEANAQRSFANMIEKITDDSGSDHKEVKKIKTFSGKMISVSVLSENDLKKVFEYLKSRSEIPFGYAKSGCQVRAYVMDLLLWHIFRIHSAKIFSLGALDVRFSNGNSVSWGYHVAPLVMVRRVSKEGHEESEFVVIDPSLSDHPLSVDQWSLKQNLDLRKVRTYITGPYVLDINSFDSKDETEYYDKDTILRIFCALRYYLDLQRTESCHVVAE